MRYNLVSVLAIGFILAGVTNSVSGDILGNIMPLGDSITAGWTVDGSYRDSLYERLNAEGYSFSFVGTQSTWPTTKLIAAGQQFHEGHSGYIIDGRAGDAPRAGLYENMATWIGPGGANRPDIILLMIGTNDMATDGGYRVGEAPARLDSLITLISDTTTGLEPDAILLVASLTPSTNATTETNIQAYNAQVPGIVNQHRAVPGENVYFVNMHDALNPATDLYDWLHPNSVGYTKMGDAWHSAIEQPTKLGDINNDGIVNDKDATVLANNWLQMTGATWRDGDFNNDGAVNEVDASILAANWQIGASSSASVPEPSTLLMLCLSLGSLVLVHR